MADTRDVVAVLRKAIDESGGVWLTWDDARAILAALELGREVEEAVERLGRNSQVLVSDLVKSHFAVVQCYEDGPSRCARDDDPESAADALLAWAREQKGERCSRSGRS